MRVRSNDSSKRMYVAFRVGHQSLVNIDKPNENRVMLQSTPQLPLPWSLLLSDRNRPIQPGNVFEFGPTGEIA
jgi:hypothetical protein